MNFNKIFKAITLTCFFCAITTTLSYAKEVNVDFSNYANAETNLTMHRILKSSGGVNKWAHIKKPTPIENQQIIRMNRDTLYSIAIVDVSKGASISIPKADKRYISMAVINTDGYTNMVNIGGGKYELNKENVGTDYALIIMRIFVDANNPEDIKAANQLQDQYKIEAKSSKALAKIAWNMQDYNKIYESLLGLFKVAKNANDMFGPKNEVDYIHFLVGTAGGFGGLPQKNAMYFNNPEPKNKAKAYKLNVKDAPVNAFWSITIYNKDGYLFKSKHGLSSINSATAKANADGSYTVYFGMCEKYKENCLAIEDGWNSIVRMYEPQESVINGTWQKPVLEVIN